jgi:hypothetical protein
MLRKLHFSAFILLAGLLALPRAGQCQTPVRLATADGVTSVTLGLLAQGMFQLDSTADRPSSTTDLYLRRMRFIASGSVTKKLTFFVESDTPFTGRVASRGWDVPPTIVQDAYATYQFSDAFRIDGGLLMVPVSYNSTQSAASLLAIGYGPYSFLASTPTHSQIGRDEGAQARGYLLGRHLEYRAGVYRGATKDVPGLPARYAARVVWYPGAPQTGFFYSGTLHGKRPTLGVGASVDHQADYHAYGVDGFAEWARPGGDSVTLQADLIRYDGGTTFRTLKAQHAWLFEAGYEFRRARLGPYLQVARQDVLAAGAPDAAAVQSGVSYWIKGNTMNLKAGIGRTMKDGASSHTQVVVQSQVFVF